MDKEDGTFTLILQGPAEYHAFCVDLVIPQQLSFAFPLMPLEVLYRRMNIEGIA